MKKIFAFVVFSFGLSSIYSYESPVGSEQLFLYGFPGLISSASSVAGGGIFDAAPYSINLNPALTAPLQRVAADIGMTIVAQSKRGNKAGMALHLGALLPSKWGVWTAAIQGAFLEAPLPPPGNMFLARLGWARDITDKLYVGVSGFVGGVSGFVGDDFGAALDLGFVYRIGDLVFLKDARIAGVVANLGKTFEPGNYDPYPGIISPKGGFAAKLLDYENFKAGFSADISFPAVFQNLLFSAGLEFNIAKIIDVSLGWSANVRELQDFEPNTPFIGIGARWTIDTAKYDLMQSHGWEKTDIAASGVWQNINDFANIVSAGVEAHFGVPDKEAPAITVDDGEAE
jgi:hypothetical protein